MTYCSRDTWVFVMQKKSGGWKINSWRMWWEKAIGLNVSRNPRSNQNVWIMKPLNLLQTPDMGKVKQWNNYKYRMIYIHIYQVNIISVLVQSCWNYNPFEYKAANLLITCMGIIQGICKKKCIAKISVDHKICTVYLVGRVNFKRP